MKCSSCFSGVCRRQTVNGTDHFTPPMMTNRTADLAERQSTDRCLQLEIQQHVSSSSPNNGNNGNFATHGESYDDRPLSMTVEEFDNESLTIEGSEEPESAVVYQSSEVARTTNIDLQVHLARCTRLEIIPEEEISDGSDSELLSPSSAAVDADSETLLAGTSISERERESGINKTASQADASEASNHVPTVPASEMVPQKSRPPTKWRRKYRPVAALQLQQQQIPTTCSLVGAKELNISPSMYRSVCTTQTVASEIMEVEIINIDSSSSSTGDEQSETEESENENAIDEAGLHQINSGDVYSPQLALDVDANIDPLNIYLPFIDEDIHEHSGASAGDIGRTNFAVVVSREARHTHEEMHQTAASLSASDSKDEIEPHQQRTRAKPSWEKNTPRRCENCKAHAQDDIFEKSQMSGSCAVCGGTVRGVFIENLERTDRGTVNSGLFHEQSANPAPAPVPPPAGERVLMLGLSNPGVVHRNPKPTQRVSGAESISTVLKVDETCSGIDRNCAAIADAECSVDCSDRDESASSLYVRKAMSLVDESCPTVPDDVRDGNQSFNCIPPHFSTPPSVIPLPPPPTANDSTASVTANVGQHTGAGSKLSEFGDTQPFTQLVPLTVEALSSAAGGTGPMILPHDAQTNRSDHSSQADHADADQNSAQDSVDAVASFERQQATLASSADKRSVLLKYMRENTSVSEGATLSQESTNSIHQQLDGCPVPTFGGENPHSSHNQTSRLRADVRTSFDEKTREHGSKIEQVRYGHCEQHVKTGSIEGGVLREPKVRAKTPNESNYFQADIVTNDTERTGENLPLFDAHNMCSISSTAPQCAKPLGGVGMSSHEKQTIVDDLKDAELQQEFRRLELETARFERELQEIALTEIHLPVAAPQKVRQNGAPNFGSGIPVLKKQPNVKQREESALKGSQRIVPVENKIPHRPGPPSTDRIPIPPPPPPSQTIPPVDEEYCTKKVKDRVRDLMATQAAIATKEARSVMKPRAGVISSAPTTPTASRKSNIAQTHTEFREIRQREVTTGEKKLHRGQTAASSGCIMSEKQQLPLQFEGNTQSSRIRHASSTSVGGLGVVCPTNSVANETESLEQNSESPEIKVNVAALIATHQEKQQLNGMEKSLPQTSGKLLPTKHTVANEIAQEDSEPTVSVSDKCRQFEQRIRKNSFGTVADCREISNIPAQTGDYAPLKKTDSETNLQIGPKFKAKPSNSIGVWSPYNHSSEALTPTNIEERSLPKKDLTTPQQLPVWTPRSAPSSPAVERREFRPIRFESPTPSRKTYAANQANSAESVAAPWTLPGYNIPLIESERPASNPQQKAQNITDEVTVNLQSHQARSVPQRSAIQQPTINSLLKSKDGKKAFETECTEAGDRFVKGKVSDSLTTRTVSSSRTSFTQQQHNDVRQAVHTSPKIEQASISSNTGSALQSKMMQQNAHKVDGIGPITREGMPLTLRSEIDEGNRDKWYKQMYQTLHKAQDDDDYVTVRYKTRRGYPYKSTGYQSEPEAAYDSDHTFKYSTIDRRRTPLGLSTSSYSKFNTLQNTAPQQLYQDSVKSGYYLYKNQPGKIEDYTPGRSSITEKETKEQKEQQKLATSKTYTEGNLSRALKEQGYESDTTLVFKKRELPLNATLSPVEQKHYYKTMQAGGEIPLQGFRKPAPEKPKDHEADVKVEIKENTFSDNGSVINRTGRSLIYKSRSTNPFLSRQEFTCYPRATSSISRPLDMLGAFPKETRLFVPPAPPNRKSSRSNSTLKIMSHIKSNVFDKQTTTTTTGTVGNHYRQSKIRSKSADPQFFAAGAASSNTTGATSSASVNKDEKNQENNSRLSSKRYIATAACYRADTSSPTVLPRKSTPSPVAFGRGISKERAFAEEKKRIEETLPKIVSVPTSILRNPELNSPNEVKKALRSSYLPARGVWEKPVRSSLKRFSSNGTFRSASSVYSSNKSLNRMLMAASSCSKKDENSLKVTVAKGTSHQQNQPRKILSRKGNIARNTLTPSVTIKTCFQKASKAFGLRQKTPSNQSLARTSSTYSIDSTNSKCRRSRINYENSFNNHSTIQHQRVIIGSSLDRSHYPARRTKSPSITVQECYSENIAQQAGNVRTGTFFQSLFLNGSGHTGNQGGSCSNHEKPTSVLEKAQLWSNHSYHSEPSLKQSNFYLSQAKPVSCSKFKTIDMQESTKKKSDARDGSDQSASRKDVLDQIHRFESLVKLADHEQHEHEQHQFGYIRGRRMEIDYTSFHERSRSEPPAETTTITTSSTVVQEELVGSNSPRTIVGRRCHMTQRTSRSPSCRRIQYLRGKEGQVRKIVRARSLSGHTKVWQDAAKDELVRSHSLNLHQEPMVSRGRFRDLNTFYNSLERLGQLERVTSLSSSGDLRPMRRTREEDIIDYDIWKRVRDQEKAERELNQLKSKLKQEQREKDLFFLPRDPEEARWRSELDTGLRNREKSVEDLKNILNHQVLSFEESKLRDLKSSKDHYKPLWRGSSVIDVASQLEEKYSSEKRDEPQSLDIISSNLLSTLSSEQMVKLKSQLNEIYSSGNQKGQPAMATKFSTSSVQQEQEYVINVPERARKLETLLKVRSHSVLTQDNVDRSQLEASARKFKLKPDGNSNREVCIAKNVQKPARSTSSPSKEEAREALSRTFCQELKDKIHQKHHTLPSIGKMKKKHTFAAMDDEPRFLSLEHKIKQIERVTSTNSHAGFLRSKDANREGEMCTRKERPHSMCDTESASSEASNRTVIFRTHPQEEPVTTTVPPVENIKRKIQYFETKQTVKETPTVTVYHAREDSSLSEEELATVYQHDGAPDEPCNRNSMTTLSQSFTDLKDLFGEKRSLATSTYVSASRQEQIQPTVRVMSPKRFIFRSRSSTPDYATCIQTGEVKKIKDKFESLDGTSWRQLETRSPVADGAERLYQSDSELCRLSGGKSDGKQNKDKSGAQCAMENRNTGTVVRHHELGDVSRITHKYEVQSGRTQSRRRSRKERVLSPIPKSPFRKDDRFMPHINVISKTASLKQEIKPKRGGPSQSSVKPAPALQQSQPLRKDASATDASATDASDARRSKHGRSFGSEEFGKLKSKFELGADLSLLGKMYTSVPDFRELESITGYLSGPWIAHQYPRPADNARSLTAPDLSPPGRQLVRKGSVPNRYRYSQQHSLRSKAHSRSCSPPRQLRHQTNDKEPHIMFPSPPLTGAQPPPLPPPPPPPQPSSLTSSSIAINLNGTESPRRYIESDVNIHYKTPIRFEYKEPVPDEELAFRQAEHMRRVYQEERHRKYIHELEDMHSRRHKDNILPSQKSPIPLNRYDDFPADLSPKPQQQQPKMIARALYNFKGQSVRELSFRKGDIIYLLRQIDKNWYEGEHNATVGLLPANYIEILTRDNISTKKPLLKTPVREGKARAKFNFTAQTSVELSLLKGELITLTRRVDDNWFEGKIGSKKGIFPVSYVEILTDIDGAESYDIVEPIIINRPQSALGLTSQPTSALSSTRMHYDDSSIGINGRMTPPGIVRETKTIQKTEVLHVDTSNEPISYRALYNYRPQNTDELELHEGDLVYVLEKCDDGWYVGTSARTGCFGTFPGNYVSKI